MATMANHHLDGETRLTLKHVPFLVEHLSGNASVWRNLGTALLFQKGDLDNIQACQPLISTSPYSFMQRLVEEWLEGKYPHTAPPTLANLLKALNSYTVGLGTLATQIRDSLPQHDQSGDAKVFEIASVSDEGDIMFNRSEDVRVNENMIICLKVRINENLMCEWRPTKPEQGGSVHDGLHDRHTPTLRISRTHIDMDGSQYSCHIIGKKITLNYRSAFEGCRYSGHIPRLKGKATAAVTLRVSCPQLDQFKESLASIYLAQPEVPQDSWPPVSNKAYINLALIKQPAINYGGEYARLTIRGDIDDILHHKEKIEYEDIFDGLRSGSLFLIEGRPGSGKTTFVHKITRDWAASEVQGPMRLILLVSLRVLNNWEKTVTLEDILQLLNLQVNSTILQERNGKGVCFIFDGLDEFSPLEGENSIVYKIINKTYLPQSIVIVASRPAALVKLRLRAHKVIEVIGFPKDQIFEYVKNYPFSNTSKSEKLKSYLLSHPNVLHMCYLPIHAAMVAFLFEVMGKVPRTETEIYKHFTRFTIIRSLSKHKEQDELEDMDTDKLSGEEKKLFETICKFALEKTILKKQVLDQGEMKLRLKSRGFKDISLGLVTVDRTAGLYGFKNIYTFLHLTYQEYLAAHHISTLSDEDQHKLITQYGDKDHMQVVWKFYCGLINFEAHEFKIKALISRKKGLFLSDIQCAYESQQKALCDCFLHETDAQIMLKNKYLTTSDFTALGYLIANSSMPISLSLTNCNMNTEAVSALLKEAVEKPLCLRTLSIESDNIDIESSVKLLSQQHSLEFLKISSHDAVGDHELSSKIQSPSQKISSHNSLDDHGFPDIISTSLANLKELSLINVQIEPTTLNNVLQFCKELSFLAIKNNSDGEEYYHNNSGELLIESLLSGVSKCKNLQRVNFSTKLRYCAQCTIDLSHNGTDFDLTLPEYFNIICIHGARGNYLQTVRLKFMTAVMQSIYLNYWPPRPKLLAIQGGLIICHDDPNSNILTSDFSTLEKLVLKNVSIDDITPFTQKLSHCVMLQEVEITYGQTRVPERILTVLTGLRSCSNLQKLVLSNIYVEQDYAYLAFGLHCWPKLQELHLRGCGIEVEGAKAIADNIKCCPKLAKVDLSEIENDKDSIAEGIAAIISGLKNCPNLQKLVMNYRYIKTNGACILASCLKHWPKLQELHLRGCDIEEEGAKAIAENIKHCPKLSKVDFSEVKINQKTLIGEIITSILISLKNCSDLLKLILNDIYIKTNSACVLASCLQYWPKLQELQLSKCDIDEKGAKAIADNIKHCPKLTKVDLSEISHKTETITYVLTSLKICSNLQELVLNNMYIKTDGACVLASCLQYWPKLQELYLGGCGIGEKGAKVIADNIKYCPELTKVSLLPNSSRELFRNKISNQTLEMIQSSLQSHIKDVKQLCNQMSESQKPHSNDADQLHHQISESQQKVTDQLCLKMSESQQSSFKNVSSVGNECVKWRKTATITNDTPPPCKRPKLLPQDEVEANIGSKSQHLMQGTSQDAGLLEMTESLHADSHNKPYKAETKFNPIHADF